MSARTKKRLTEIEVKTGEDVIRFKDIPVSKVKAIIVSLDDYREESIPWRELAKDRINASGGESAHMVRAARQRAGLTQVELAEKIEMPQANLSQIETGRRPVGKVVAKRLGKVLGINYRTFL